ncbi:MAG: pantetheine-phosphate adenylyltransferase [Clostridiales bacterium]|nr:pantetheine-phosphate adenylyltransferase [Clostridiales bacterium]
MEKQIRKCVFAGTFDPLTLGHQNLIEECLKLFDEVVVAILVNPAKQPYFTLQQRQDMLALAFGHEPRVRVITSGNTVAEILKAENTPFYVRGIRNSIDLDYENANFYASKKLDANLTAVYLPCPQHLLHVSSSMVRNSLKFHTPIDEYVSKPIKNFIENVIKEGEK